MSVLARNGEFHMEPLDQMGGVREEGESINLSGRAGEDGFRDGAHFCNG